MSRSAKRLSRSMLFVLPATLAWAASAPAQSPAWLALPAWQQPVEAVKAAEGNGATTHEARPGSQISGADFLLSTPAQADAIAISREFYFDAARNLMFVRIVPAKTDPGNCDALLAATTQVLGEYDERPSTGAIPLMLIDNRYWFRRKEDRLYRWFQIKSLRGPSANTPCGLFIEPYKAGMKRKAAAR